jgi:hypothetical protein
MARDIIFVLITFVLFALWGLPNLRVVLILLFSHTVESHFEEDEDGIVPEDYPEETQKLIGSLRELGFVPLGIKSEKRPLQSGKELAFASAEDQCFAAVFRYESEAPHFYFYTPFRDGAVVLTADHGMEAVRTETFLHWGVPNKLPVEVLQQHRKQVERMSKNGHEPYRVYSRKSRLQATEGYYDNPGASKLQKKLFWKSLGNFGTSVGLVLLAVLFLLYRFWKN